MGNYAKRDARAAHSHYVARLWPVAEQLLGRDAALRSADWAVWLFCRSCGDARLTDAHWFLEIMQEGETVEHRRQMLPCGRCRRAGGLMVILAPGTLANFARMGRVVLRAKKEPPTFQG